MITETIVVAFIVICAFIFFLVKLGMVAEKLLWNNGTCMVNEKPWVYFDTDSSGARGYKAGERVCWISYNHIDAKAVAIAVCDICDESGMVHYGYNDVDDDFSFQTTCDHINWPHGEVVEEVK